MRALIQTPMPALLSWRRFVVFALFLFFSEKVAAQQPGCVDSSLIDPDAVCITLWDPVCGCNGITYGNSCVAVYFGGVTEWTPGECDDPPPLSCDNLVPDFSATVAADPLTIEFTNFSLINGATSFSWYWEFGDGTTSGAWNPVHTYAAQGVYTVCLHISALIAGEICEKTLCQTVATGQDCPSGCFFDIYYALNGLNFHAWLLPNPTDPIVPDSVYWTLDGVPTGPVQPEFFYLFDEPGEHVVCATYPKVDGGSCTACKAVRVTAACVDSSLIDSLVVCTAIYDPVCGCDGVTYPNDCEAKYHHGVTAWTPGECGSVCNDLWVDFTGFNSGGSLTLWTFNGEVNFPGGTVTGWFWNFGNGQTSTDPNPTLNFFDPGDYQVCLTVTTVAPDGTPCDHTVCQTVHVAGTLCIDPALVDTTLGCPTIYDPVCGCDGVTYSNSCEAQVYHGVTSWTPGVCPTDCIDLSWTIPDIACPEIYDPVCGCDGVTYSNACEALRYFGITAWKEGACCTAPEECKAAFILEKLPNRTVRISDNSTNAESWTLDFGDGFVYYGWFDSLLHTYAAPGIYPICLTISNFAGTCTHTYCETVDFSTSAAGEPDSGAGLILTPNPARERAFVQVQGAIPRRVAVYDVFGKKWLEKTVATPEFELELGGVPEGLCLVVVETDRGVAVRKLVVKR